MTNAPANISCRYIPIIIFVFICPVVIFFSCKKENPVSSTVSPPPIPPPTLPSTPIVTNLQLYSFGTLSKARYNIVAGAAGNKILFAGGYYVVPRCWYDSSEDMPGWYDCRYESARVDIYDTATNTWSTHDLARYYVQQTAITIGSKIYFTGGVDTADRSYSKKIDIYDASSNSWSTSAEWSKPRHGMGVGSLGNKIFFAGGFESTGFQSGFISNKVDIYDVSSNSWSVAALSEARCSPVVASVGNKIIFAGGNSCGWGPISGKVDIYDAATNTWSASVLSETRTSISSIVIADKAFFIGGHKPIDFRNGIPSYVIDIYDNTTQSWSVKPIDFFTGYSSSILIGKKGYFFLSGKIVKIYNDSNGIWSDAVLDRELLGSTAIIAVGNRIYFAGGGSNADNQTSMIWKLEF